MQLNIKKKKKKKERKKNQPGFKMDRGTEQTFFFPQIRDTDGQQACGKILNITSQNSNVILPHTCQNGEKRTLLHLLMRMQIGIAIIEKSMEVPQKMSCHSVW